MGGLALNTGLRTRVGTYGPHPHRVAWNAPPQPLVNWYTARIGSFFLCMRAATAMYSREADLNPEYFDLEWNSDPFSRTIAYWTKVDPLAYELKRLAFKPADPIDILAMEPAPGLPNHQVLGQLQYEPNTKTWIQITDLTQPPLHTRKIEL